ncbi:unnamed protein product, partial [Sphacelaria rigidula]
WHGCLASFPSPLWPWWHIVPWPLRGLRRSSASSLLRDLATLAYYFCIVGVATLFIWNNIYLGEGKGAAAVAVLLGLDAGEWAVAVLSAVSSGVLSRISAPKVSSACSSWL